MSIRLKLTIMFLAIASIPLLFVSVLTFSNYKKSLEATRFSQLQDLAVFRADRIEAYFAGLKGHIEIAQGFYNIKRNLPILIRFADEPNNPEFLAARKMLDGQLQQMQSVSDFSDIMLLNPQGRVVYTIKPGHYSKDMSNGLDAERKAFTEGKSRAYFSGIYFDKAEDNRFEMLLTAPASDFNGVFIGVIAFEVDMTPVYKLIQDTTGLGDTGEVLVGKKIGNQVEYLNPLRHDPNAALNRRIDIGDEIGRPMQEAVQGRTGKAQYFDYRGKKVIAAWRYIPSMNWGMVAKIDAKEAFADVTNLRNLAAVVLVIVIVLSGVTAFSIAQSISEPIKRLSEGAGIIGSGNLDYKVATAHKDEIGQLSRTFDKMTGDLKQTLASRDELNREVAERRKKEEELYKLNRTLRALSNSNQAMMHAKDEMQYLQDVCDIVVKDCGHTMVWVGFAENDEIKSVRPVAFAGLEKGYLETLKVTWADTERGQGPTGTAIRTGKTCFCRNMLTDPAFATWRQEALKRGYASSIVLPLMNGDKAFGALTIYSKEADPFSQDEVNLLTELAGDLAYGISAIRLRIARDEAEKALQESEQHLSAVFRASPTGIFVTRLDDGLFLEANEAYLQIIGYPADEVIGHTSPELNIWINSEDRKWVVNTLRQKGRIENNEIKFRRKNGEIVDLLYSALPLERGGEQCILGTLTDISSRKRVEEALRQSEERFKVIASSTPDHILVQDRDLKYTFVINPQLGLREQDMIGKTDHDFLTKDDAENLTRIKRQVLDTGRTIHIETPLISPEGQTQFFSGSYVPKYDAEGHIDGLIGYFSNVTARKKAEEEVCRSAERFALFSETASDLLQSKNPQQIINKLCLKVLKHLDCHIFVNYLVDEQTHRLHLNATGGLSEKTAMNIEWLNFGQAICGRVAQEGKPIIAENIQESCDARADLVRSMGIKAYACHPLMSQGRVIGTLSFGTSSRKKFSVDDVAVMKTVTDQVATAMERMRAEEAVKKSRDELEIRVKERTAELDESVVELQKQVENRIRAEEAFRSASLYARGLLEASLDPLVTISAEGKITDVNEATIQVTGVSREKLIGTDFSDYFTEPQKAREGYKKVFNVGFVTDYPLTIRHKNGRLTDVLYNAVVYKNEAGQIQGVFAAARDITEKKIAEAELEKYRLHLEDLVKHRTEALARSNKDLEQFAYVASHDLQEPLRAVAGFIGLLKMRLESKLDEKTSEFMNFSVDGVSRMQTLINGLLEYSRIDTRGKSPEPTDSKAALDNALLQLRASVEESGAKITAENLPTVQIDPVQLVQLFQNLVGNAIKFRSESAPLIHVSATRKDGAWQFAVRDNGIGIDPQYAHKIFLIFQRLHTRKQYPGTGIGLSICKKIIERHGGRIWMDSQPGKGSTFYFTIPDTQGA